MLVFMIKNILLQQKLSQSFMTNKWQFKIFA